MEVLTQAAAVVLVRMAQHHHVHIRASFLVNGKFLAQILEHVAHTIAGLPDIDIDKNRPAAGQFNKGHISVAYGEKGDFRRRHNC